MVGVITGRDILAHPFVTIHCFGWQVFFKAIAPWQNETFLSLVQSAESLSEPIAKVPGLLDRCINLELRAKRIYTALGKSLDEEGLVGPFFAGLARQEQQHADLLELCRSLAVRGNWRENVFSPWETFLPQLERQMDAAEAAVPEIDSVDAALQLVVEIELSEVNEIFRAVLVATDAAFVKKLKPFQEAMEAHMIYIMERLPELSPNLILASRDLQTRFPELQI